MWCTSATALPDVSRYRPARPQNRFLALALNKVYILRHETKVDTVDSALAERVGNLINTINTAISKSN